MRLGGSRTYFAFNLIAFDFLHSGQGSLEMPFELEFHLLHYLATFMFDIEDCVSRNQYFFALDLDLKTLALL